MLTFLGALGTQERGEVARLVVQTQPFWHSMYSVENRLLVLRTSSHDYHAISDHLLTRTTLSGRSSNNEHKKHLRYLR